MSENGDEGGFCEVGLDTLVEAGCFRRRSSAKSVWYEIVSISRDTISQSRPMITFVG